MDTVTEQIKSTANGSEANEYRVIAAVSKRVVGIISKVPNGNGELHPWKLFLKNGSFRIMTSTSDRPQAKHDAIRALVAFEGGR